MLLIRVITILTLLSLALTSVAQKTPQYYVDSLLSILQNKKSDSDQLKTLIQLIVDYNDVDGKEGLKYEKQALDLAAKLNDKIGEGEIRNAVGRIYWRSGALQTALQYHFEAKRIFTEQDDKIRLGKTYRYLGQDFLIVRDYEPALENFSVALSIYESINDIKGQAVIYNLLSWTYAEQGDFKESYRLGYIGLKLYEQINDRKGIAIMLSGISENSMYLGNYEEALETFKICIEVLKEFGDVINVGVNYNVMGKASRLLGNYSTAIQYHDSAIAIGKRATNYNLLGMGHDGIGDTYKDQGNYNKALDHYLQSTSMFGKWFEKQDIARVQTKIAESYRLIKKYREAHIYLDSAIALSKDLKSKKLTTNNYHEAELIDSATGNWKGAYQNHSQYIIYRDSVFGQQATKEMVLLQKQYEFDKKQEAERVEQELKDRQKQRQIIFLGIITSLVLTLAAVLFRSRQQQIKTNLELKTKSENLEEENREKTSILNIVTHDLKAPLNKIKGLTDLMEVSDKSNTEEQKQYLSFIRSSIDQGNHLIKNLLDAQAVNDEVNRPSWQNIDLVKTLSDFKSSMEGQLLKKEQRLSIQFDNVNGPFLTDHQMFIRVLDNLVSNASKFSEKGKSIHLSVQNVDNKLNVSIRDEGPGISDADQKKLFRKFQTLSARPTNGEGSAGLGLSITKVLVEKLNGSIKVESKLGEGTEFIISFHV